MRRNQWTSSWKVSNKEGPKTTPRKCFTHAITHRSVGLTPSRLTLQYSPCQEQVEAHYVTSSALYPLKPRAPSANWLVACPHLVGHLSKSQGLLLHALRAAFQI